MFEDTDPWNPRKACYNHRVELKRCLLQTDCCRVDRKTPKECMQSGQATECDQLRTAFFECKRSILDMRTRFRGRK